MNRRINLRQVGATAVLVLSLVFGVALTIRPDDPVNLSRQMLMTLAAGFSPEELTAARIDPSVWREVWARAQADLHPDQWESLVRAVDQARQSLSEAMNTADRPGDGRSQSNVAAATLALESAARAMQQFVAQIRQRIVNEFDPVSQQRIGDVQLARQQGIPPEFGSLRLSEVEARQLKQDLRNELRQQTSGEPVDSAVAARLGAQRARCVPVEPSELRRVRLTEFETWFSERLQARR